jgi:hypothetical protein
MRELRLHHISRRPPEIHRAALQSDLIIQVIERIKLEIFSDRNHDLISTNRWQIIYEQELAFIQLFTLTVQVLVFTFIYLLSTSD